MVDKTLDGVRETNKWVELVRGQVLIALVLQEYHDSGLVWDKEGEVAKQIVQREEKADDDGVPA